VKRFTRVRGFGGVVGAKKHHGGRCASTNKNLIWEIWGKKHLVSREPDWQKGQGGLWLEERNDQKYRASENAREGGSKSNKAGEGRRGRKRRGGKGKD